MNGPKFSIIIPAYNNAEYLGETIQSCLDQTYPNLEVIVVNDASPDNAQEVVQQFDDVRIRYMVHDINKGLSAARNTGIRASSGEYIAVLDGDDLFHPHKVASHVEFLENHPEIHVTYNPRFELNHSSPTIRELWRPPRTVSLADLVLGFPFSPSDMVMRREWAFRVDLFDEYHTYVGEDLDINCRLALAGCKFASVDRALNYRRYHSKRIVGNLRKSVDDTLRPLKKTFVDPRCPDDVLHLKDIAPSIHLMLWSLIAFDQNDTILGREYLTEAVRLNPAILTGQPCQLLDAIVSFSVADESRNHEDILRNIQNQLPEGFSWIVEHMPWAVNKGYLYKGVRAMIWDRLENGKEYIRRIADLRSVIDKGYLKQLATQLLDFEHEFGAEKTKTIYQTLYASLLTELDRSLIRWFLGYYQVNQAFQNYSAGAYSRVPLRVVKAIANDYNYFSNRGVVSIFFRSLVGMWTN